MKDCYRPRFGVAGAVLYKGQSNAMKPKELQKHLKSEGFVFYRSTGKHNIYVHEVSGKKLSISKTPSDKYAWKQVIRDIKKYKLAEV